MLACAAAGKRRALPAVPAGEHLSSQALDHTAPGQDQPEADGGPTSNESSTAAPRHSPPRARRSTHSEGANVQGAVVRPRALEALLDSRAAFSPRRCAVQRRLTENGGYFVYQGGGGAPVAAAATPFPVNLYRDMVTGDVPGQRGRGRARAAGAGIRSYRPYPARRACWRSTPPAPSFTCRAQPTTWRITSIAAAAARPPRSAPATS